MSGARPASGTCAVLLAIMLPACATTVVVAEGFDGNPSPDVLRVASELGLADVSTDAQVRVEIPIEIRAGPGRVQLPGCAVTGHLTTRLAAGGFALRFVDPGVITVTVGASAEGTDQAGVVVVPPNTRRIVTLTVAADRNAVQADTLGVRLDSRAAALSLVGGCPELHDPESAHIQDFALHRTEVETGGVAVAAGVLMLLVVVASAGR